MGVYRFTDPQTGKKLKFTGDAPPTEDVLREAFRTYNQGGQRGAVNSPATNTISANATTPAPKSGSPKWLKVAKEGARVLGETAGLVGGGIIGSGVGPAGTVAGAALGYGAVKQLERFLEGEKATLPQAAIGAVKDVGTGAAMEMGGQAVGRVIGGALEKISNPAISTLPKYVVSKRLSDAKKLGIKLTPAEATESKGLSLYESMLDKSPFSTGIVNKWRESNQIKPLIKLRERALSEGDPQQVEVLGQKIRDQVNKHLGQVKGMDEAQLNNLRNDVMKKYGSSEAYETLGKAAQDAIAEKSKSIYSRAGELYSKVGELVPEGTKIVPANMQQTATRLLAEESGKPPSLQNQNVMKILRDLSGSDDALMAEANAYPEPMRSQVIAKLKEEGRGALDWKSLQSTRSELNSRIAQSDAAIRSSQPGAKFQSTPEAAVYKQLKKSIDSDISDFAASQGGEIKESFDLANAFYKEGKEVYNSKTIKRIINANPERLVDTVFRPNGGFEVDAIRKAIGDESFNRTVKPLAVKRLLGNGEVFSPKELSSKLKSYGDDILGKTFSPKEIEMIKGLASDGQIQLEQRLTGQPFLRTIANERPEVVVDSIVGSYDRFPGAKNILSNVLSIKSTVDKPTFDALRKEMTDRIFKLNQLTDQVQPEMLSKTVQKYEKVLKVMYPEDQLKWLKDIAATGKRMAAAEALAKNPSGTAQNVITWGTFGAIMHNPISGIATGIVTPKMMANFYLSPMGRRYFTMGLKTPLGTKRGVALATKIAEIAGVDLYNQSNNNDISEEAIPEEITPEESIDQTSEVPQSP